MAFSADAERPRSLGYRTDLALLVAQGSSVEQRDGYLVLRTPANPSYHWGNCLILDDAPRAGSLAAWAEVFLREHPGARHLALGIDADLVEVDPAEAAGLGIDVEHDTVLTARRLTAPGPEIGGVVCRFVDPHDDGSWSALVELEAASFGDTQSHREFVTRRFDGIRPLLAGAQGVWVAAYEGDRAVASLGAVAVGGGTVRYQHVVTHPDHRRRGIAGRLLRLAGQHAVDTLAAERLVIVADASGPAIGVYRAAGFSDTSDQWSLYRAPDPSPTDRRPVAS
jgi:ribosomal protein S18 acetylase RimI-like enzyme